MYTVFILVTIFLLSAYLFLFVYSNIGWRKITNDDSIIKASNTYISIVIPFRNEIDNLEVLLDSFEKQTYSKENYEVIMVNDHSEDKGLEFLIKKQKELSFKLVIKNLPDDKQFKKKAIEEGISIAKGNLIVTSDADTFRKENYLSRIASFYEKKKSSMIIMPVILLSGNNFLERFQVLEFLSLQWITASFAGNNNAILCNGANLAFEKEIFEKTGGFKNTPKVVSGDDFFLLMKLRNQKKSNISILLSKDVIVKTKSLSSLKEFVQQRMRWAGKAKYANNTSIYLTGSLNVLLSFYLILLPFIEYNLTSFPLFTFLFWIVKICGDLLMLRKAGSFFNTKINLIDFLFSILYYPFYICSIFIFSLVLKPKWKGREIR